MENNSNNKIYINAHNRNDSISYFTFIICLFLFKLFISRLQGKDQVYIVLYFLWTYCTYYTYFSAYSVHTTEITLLILY